MKRKIIRMIGWTVCISVFLVAVYFLTAFFGNPISSAVAKRNAEKYLQEHFAETDFQIENVGYDLKSGGYFARIHSPSSIDSHFTIYFDSLGRYKYDSYFAIDSKNNTIGRLDEGYFELTNDLLSKAAEQYDISISFGELKIAELYEIYSYTDKQGHIQHYTLSKNYGIDRDSLVVDGEYDIRQLGQDHGCITLYIHDPELSVERAAELLLEIKDCFDDLGLPFHAIEFHLCEPRNEAGQMTDDQITLYEFLYSDIYEDGLVDRVVDHWNIAREHHAIQDALKLEAELLVPYFIDIREDNP